MKEFRAVVVFAVVLMMCGSVAMAGVVTLNPVKDSGMYQANAGGNSNRGDGGRFDIGPGTDGALLQFDLSGVTIPAGQQILSAVLRLKTASGSTYGFDMSVVAYPLADAWQEGIGTTGGVSGSTGFPWGDVSIGDAVYNYQNVTAVAPDATYGNYNCATAGVAWGAGGGRDIGTDVLDRLMIDTEHWVLAQGSRPVGTAFQDLEFTAVGIDVLTQWINDTLDNNGFNIWGLVASTDPDSARVGSSELAGAVPELILTIGAPVPEPATMCLLAVGGIGLIAARRRRTA